MPRRPILFLTIVACLLAAVSASSASAASNQEVTFESPLDFVDASVRGQTFDEVSAFGVRSIRVMLYWKDVAPNATSRLRPKGDLSAPSSYDWSKYQPIFDEAESRGMRVLLTVTSPAPIWATKRANDDVTRPSPDRFREFVMAVSRQFGSTVTQYSFINQPNLPQFLTPQYEKGKAVSPAIYRGLYDAALRGLKAVGDTKPVLMGETAPNGAAPRTVAPIDFLRGALCLNSQYKRVGGCTKLRVDGWAHHAYTRRDGPLVLPVERLVTVGALSRLTDALDRAAKTGAVKRKLKVYLTEFGVQSVPDPNYGVSLQQQNEFRAIAEKIAYDNPRVASFSQYLMTDDPPTGKGSNCCGRFESGLKTSKRVNKPAYDGFRLPMVAELRGSSVRLWGLVRPAKGLVDVTLQRRSGSGAWKTISEPVTNSRGVWTARSSKVKSGSWRVLWIGPDDVTYESPAVRAYTWPSRLR